MFLNGCSSSRGLSSIFIFLQNSKFRLTKFTYNLQQHNIQPITYNCNVQLLTYNLPHNLKNFFHTFPYFEPWPYVSVPLRLRRLKSQFSLVCEILYVFLHFCTQVYVHTYAHTVLIVAYKNLHWRNKNEKIYSQVYAG